MSHEAPGEPPVHICIPVVERGPLEEDDDVAYYECIHGEGCVCHGVVHVEKSPSTAEDLIITGLVIEEDDEA